MNKEEYLAELKKRLNALPESERQDAMEYYEGYLDDAGKSVKKAMNELGTPAEVAAKILAEFAVKERPTDGETVKNNGPKIALGVMLAVFAAPIALPLAIAVFAVALALLVTLLSLIFAFGVTGVALMIGGIVYLPIAVIVLVQNVSAGIAVIGSGLLMLGAGIFFFAAAYWLAKIGFGLIARFAGKTILRKETR